MATLTRKTEVTKLITVTLGKIQESKHAKCGLNLRKSLLVASVLHKARNIYVTEVKNRTAMVVGENISTTTKAGSNHDIEDSNNKKLSCCTTDSDSPTVNVPVKVRRFSSLRSMSVIEEEQSSQTSEVDVDPSYHSHSSSDNNETSQTTTTSAQSPHTTTTFTHLKDTPSSSRPSLVRPEISSSLEEDNNYNNSSSDSVVINDILDDLASASEDDGVTSGKENSPPSAEQVQQPVLSCGRCLKRRASTDYPDSDNNNQSSYQSPSFFVPLKRSRSVSVDSSVCDTYEDSNSKAQPMDTTQINNLVNIFSQSFQDFASTDTHDAGSVYETSTEMNTFALCRDSIALTA